MLSMFKDKKGFSVLFRDAHQDPAIPLPLSADMEASARRSSRVSSALTRPTGGSGVAQLQCQRCSKRFSALADNDDEGQACCRRCGYPTCPQCREAVAGSPPWVCCVCVGPKSFMWLLEKTKMGPRLVSKIVEYCDPRGQRLMRSMFRFTLQQYRAVSSPRPSLAITAAASNSRVSGSRAGSGGVSTSFRPAAASQTPPAAPSAASKSRTAGRTSGERNAGSTGLSAVSASHSNVHRPSPYSHPKHASLLRSAGRLTATEGKENSPATTESPKRPHGSEALRRDDAAGVVEYSPEPNRQIVKVCEPLVGGTTHSKDEDGNANVVEAVDLQTPPPRPPVPDLCTAVQDIYRASDSAVTPRSTATRHTTTTAEVSASPHVRPSGHAAFQREPLRQLAPNASTNMNANSDGSTPVAREAGAVAATLKLDATTMSVTPPGQPCRFGRSLSRASSGSARSESPAPRFPSFVQFLDDQAAVGAGQTHLPRESDVLVTVSPDSSDDDDDPNSNVMELGGTRSGRLTNKSNRGGVRTPRGTQPCTPPSAGGASSSRRNERRTSGLSGEYTPTRALDLSDARATVRRGSSSRRRTTRGSLLEMHAPHLYGSGGGGGTGRRSGQVGDSPFMYDLPSQFSANSGTGRVHSARGQIRRQHAPLATRTAGRPLGGGAGVAADGRGRLARQNSRTTTPLQRTASRNAALQRVPSGNRAMARTNSTNAGGPFARKNSATTGFARLHSGTAQLTRTPSSRTRLAGVPLSPNGRQLQRTESTKLVRTASATGHPPMAAVEPPTALERTHSLHHTVPSPLQRTASHGGLGGGPSPFVRFHSATAFTRSATVTAGFTRTQSANVFSRNAAPAAARGSSSSTKNTDGSASHPHQATGSAFARTATGTYLSRGVGGRGGVFGRGARPAPPVRGRAVGLTSRVAAPTRVSYATARTKTPTNARPGTAASPLHRTGSSTAFHPATASASGGTGGAGVRPPTPTGFARTATNPRAFERQPSYPLRQPPASSSSSAHAVAAGGRARVDPAPALVGVARRKAAGGPAGLRRTPSAMSRSDSATAATPRTPRPYVIASVSTAGTPAAAAAAAAAASANAVQHATRPVLSSGASSPKTRSTRDSLTSGSAGTTRMSGGGAVTVTASGALSPVSHAPVVKAPSGAALAGRTSAPRRRPEAAGAGGAGRVGAFSRLGTGVRSNTPSGSGAGVGGRARTGSAHPPGGFVRLNSRPLA